MSERAFDSSLNDSVIRTMNQETESSTSKRVLAIPHSVIVRAPGLLPMYYTTSELALEVGVEASRIVRWAKAGAPHRRDGRNHIWISGREFAAWVEETRAAEVGQPMQPGEGYCMRCRAPVEMDGPVLREKQGRKWISGTCPRCGARVNRGVRNGQQTKLPMG